MVIELTENQKTAAGSFVGDNPTDEDRLGFQVYVTVLSRFIENLKVEKETPICIGIHGEWGSGKTSLMRQLEKKLKKQRNKRNRILTVWFDAWKYDRVELHWAVLLQVVLSAIWEDKSTQLKGLDGEAKKAAREKLLESLRTLSRMGRNLSYLALRGLVKKVASGDKSTSCLSCENYPFPTLDPPNQ